MTQADSKPVIIALDAMGGEKAPDMVIKGANVARARHPEMRFVLFGDESRLFAGNRIQEAISRLEVRAASDDL